MSIVILVNIAADAATILDSRLNDKRRSAPFLQLAARADHGMPRDLGAALQRTVESLRVKHPAVAEEIEECLVRWRDEMRDR